MIVIVIVIVMIARRLSPSVSLPLSLSHTHTLLHTLPHSLFVYRVGSDIYSKPTCSEKNCQIISSRRMDVWSDPLYISFPSFSVEVVIVVAVVAMLGLESGSQGQGHCRLGIADATKAIVIVST